jgi:2-polyprenyl-3-methyl-5-hydroxy-6-metoxy-1,4-benzoquinol methylase
VIINGAGLLMFLSTLPDANSYTVAMTATSMAVEVIVIAALYRSQRVRNTFPERSRTEPGIDIPAVQRAAANPQPYDAGTAQMWTDEYISRQLLALHLDPNTELASRRPAEIDAASEWMLQRLGKPSADILDLGCGPGLYAERFARAGHRVTGVDFSRSSIDYASESAAKQGLNITYIRDDYLERAFTTRFDLAVMIYCDFGVLSLKDRSILMHNVGQALRPGGLFIFDAFNDAHIHESMFGQHWEIAEAGFWQPAPYVHMSETLHFPQHRATLDQHIVIGEDGAHKLYRFWNHYFGDSELDGAFRLAGFSGVTAHHDVVGGEDITFFCAVK